ncbi:MAG: hypothetical protein PVF93_12400 [Chromatiaceae bacterium]|jgi:malate dehydrogenase (quinone)
MTNQAGIDAGVGVIVDMTSSPGVTCCLENAQVDMPKVAGSPGAMLGEVAVAHDLPVDDQRHVVENLPVYYISGIAALAANTRPDGVRINNRQTPGGMRQRPCG